MKEYYTHDGQEQKGPMTLEGLLRSGITGDSQIWHAGLAGWQPARELEELTFFFEKKEPVPMEQAPPPMEQALLPMEQAPLSPAYTAPPRPSFGYIPPPAEKSIGRTMPRSGILLLLIVAAMALVFYIVSSRNKAAGIDDDREAPGTSKISVVDYERAHPAEFLSAGGSYNKILLGKKIKIYGTVTNKATVTNFKNISIQVSYYSAAKKLISTDHFVLAESVPAHGSKSFEKTIRPPAGMVSVSWTAQGAKPY